MKSNSVLLVDLSEAYGGVDVRVFDTAAALDAARRDYSVAVINQSRVHHLLLEHGLRTTAFQCSKYHPKLIGLLSKEVARHRYAVVDAHNSQSWLWSGLALGQSAKAKLVTSVQLPCRRIPGGLKGYIEEHIVRHNNRIGSQFLIVSEEIRSYLRSLGVPDSRITHSYNTINMELVRKQAMPFDVRKLANWPKDTHVTCIVGRLAKQKGHDFLFQAMRSIRDTHPQLRCLVVGDGPLSASLQNLINDLNLADRVHFAGFRSDIPSILASVDSFCLPSRGEGLPYAMLEACTFQLPILVSRTDAIEELFVHTDTAYLVSVGETAEIADGLRWLMERNDLATNMGIAAHEFVDRRLSPKRMIEETFALYDS